MPRPHLKNQTVPGNLQKHPGNIMEFFHFGKVGTLFTEDRNNRHTENIISFPIITSITERKKYQTIK